MITGVREKTYPPRLTAQSTDLRTTRPLRVVDL